MYCTGTGASIACSIMTRREERRTEMERELGGRIRDFSENYHGYKDLNDYLCGKRQNLVVNPPLRNIVKPKKKGLGL